VGGFKQIALIEEAKLAAPQLPPVNGSSCSNCCDLGQSIQHGAYCRKCKHHTRLSLVKLREHLGRRIAKHPSIAIARDRDRGLSSGDGSYGTIAHPAAVKAIAIPLREAPAGRRAENTNEHDPAIMNERRDRGLAARRRLAALPQRLHLTETYELISIPNRNSITTGVSHFMFDIPNICESGHCIVCLTRMT
jgi:hypothetical protein